MSWTLGFVFLLAFVGVPLFVVIGGAAILSNTLDVEAYVALPLNKFFVTIVDKLTKADLFIALPFFAFAGFLLAESNAPRRLVHLCRSAIGWLPGGLGIVAILVCAVFTAFTGASGVTIIALGGLLYPALVKNHYPERFSLGLLTTCGSLGLLFAPSLPLIIYALVASNASEEVNVKVTDLFLAGILPGVLLVVFLALYTVWKQRGVLKAIEPEEKPLSFRQALREAIFEIPLPFIILGGFYGGFLSPDQIATVMLVYVLVVEVFIYRDIKLRQLPGVVKKSMVLLGAIMIILMISIGYSAYLSKENVPYKILLFMRAHLYEITFVVLLNLAALLISLFGFLMVRKSVYIVAPLCFLVANGAYMGGWLSERLLYQEHSSMAWEGKGELLLEKKVPSQLASELVKEGEFTLKGLDTLVEERKWLLRYTGGKGEVESVLLFRTEEGVRVYRPWIPAYVAFLIVLNVFLLIVGCLMDIFSAILLVVPIIAPIAYGFGINPYHLGIIFLTNLEIGYSTPPVGINLFISSLRFKKSIVEVYWASIPFLVILLIALAIITYIPWLSLVLLGGGV